MTTQTSQPRTDPPAPADAVKTRSANRVPGQRSLAAAPSTWFVWAGTAAFFIFLIGILISVVVDSFGTSWFTNWLPEGFTAKWYASAWSTFGMAHIIGVTLVVALAVIIVAVAVGVPAAYILARRDFPFKKAITLLFLLPVLMPPITYGIPLATVMYNLGLGRTLTAVILVNLVPSIPFVILTMTPFIEQINPAIENAARMSGANMRKVFTKILFPLLVPGVLAASILVLVRTVGMFDLTFLVSGPDSDTLVVAIYRAMTAAGGGQIRQLVSSMAVVYTVTMMFILIIALRFVSPTQLVARVKESRED
ncbi:ABC transporter permease [Demequina lutea]|uniref:Putative spermidine/putrescine transport system permease protein n=1 Tax=Demequina lutea TaxID=431489 RepID=A0A7Y9ZDC1_9MICO|nr:ABC transporter permease subunit [Demequina lutea]NYI42498.1 putative spermidine/putrescine transport system permease protein [Demequina lutea]